MYLSNRVVDLGVMTPCDKILKTAQQVKAGMNVMAVIMLWHLWSEIRWTVNNFDARNFMPLTHIKMVCSAFEGLLPTWEKTRCKCIFPRAHKTPCAS